MKVQCLLLSLMICNISVFAMENGNTWEKIILDKESFSGHAERKLEHLGIKYPTPVFNITDHQFSSNAPELYKYVETKLQNSELFKGHYLDQIEFDLIPIKDTRDARIKIKNFRYRQKEDRRQANKTLSFFVCGLGVIMMTRAFNNNTKNDIGQALICVLSCCIFPVLDVIQCNKNYDEYLPLKNSQ